MDLNIITKEVISIARQAADFIKSNVGKVANKDIETKEKNSLVSFVDKKAEEMIVNALKPLIHSAGFITEEDTIDQVDEEYIWVIDPLDGTTNFLHGIPIFSVSIALEKKGKPIIGVVHDVMLGQTYWAIKNQGAFCDEKPIQVSPTKKMSDALIVTGFPYNNNTYSIEDKFAVIKHWILHCRGIRRLGSAALDLTYIASGKTDGYYESSLSRWDISAGTLIVKEAGGKISDFSGNDNYLTSGNIVASNAYLYPEVLKPIKEHLAKE